MSANLVYVEQELTDGAVYKGYTRDGNIREGKGEPSPCNCMMLLVWYNLAVDVLYLLCSTLFLS